MEHSLLHNAVIYLAAAVVAVPIFRKLGLGAILGYLTAGAIIGPQGLQFIADPEHTLHFAEFGVVMLLFVIGLELNPEKLWQMRGRIALLGGGQLLLSASLIVLCITFLGSDFSNSINWLIGLTLALSSTAFAVQLMGEQGIMGLPLGRKGFSILLLQDLAVIPILLFVSFLAPESNANNGTPWWQGPVAVVALLGAGRFAINPVLRMVADSGIHELLTASALLIVLGSALLMQATGLTMGMGAFLAGIILGTCSFRHQLEADIEPFKGLLLGLFFIAVGMSLDLALFISQPLQILLLAVALMAVKCVVIAALVRLAGSNWRDSFLLGLLLSQGGEFAFVVMNKASTSALIPEASNDYIILVVGISMALTSPLILLYQRLGFRHHQPTAAEPLSTQKTDDEPEVVIAGFGRFGQIVGRILAANQLHFTALDKNAEHVEFVNQFGNRIFFGNAARPELLQAAGIDHARILVVAVDSNKDSLSIVNEVRTRYPKIIIIARAHNRDHAYQLYQAGVKIVIRETLESSLLAANHTLTALGYTDIQAMQLVNIFRNHDEKMVLEASAHDGDLEQLLEISKEGRKELELLFKQDHKL